MAGTDGLRLVTLSDRHIEGGLALSSEAAWNQTSQDWRFMLAHGQGWGFEAADGRLVATGLVLPQGPAHAWVSMVLVTTSRRRQGLATALVERCLRHCEAHGLTPWLDATPAGEQVYGRLGLHPVGRLLRLHAGRPRPQSGVGRVHPASRQDLERIVSLDREASGGERRSLLEMLSARAPGCALLADDGTGFALGRDGRTATQIGPVVAEGTESALGLVDAALASLEGACIVDAVAEETAFIGGLRERGFVEQRPFARMVRGTAPTRKGPARLFAAAGPELG